MAGFMTENWSSLGDLFYRKFEMYQMSWADHVSISEYNIAAAPYGGPIAITRKEMHLVRANAKQSISIYNAAGRKIHDFRWQGGHLLDITWCVSEKLLCVQDDGTILIMNIFGEAERTLSMGEEARDLKIMECKTFESSSGHTGIVAMTTAYKFWIILDIDKENPRARKMADVPGLSAPPSSWGVLVRDNGPVLLVARDEQLFVIDHIGQCQQIEPLQTDYSDIVAYVAMAVSPQGNRVALYTAKGILWIGFSNLKQRICEVDVNVLKRPVQMAWCGNMAVVVNHDKEIQLFGIRGDWVKYPTYDSDVVIVPEPDGARIFSSDIHEFVHRVPDATEKIFHIGSVEPGAMLFEALKEYENKSQRAIEYLEGIENVMEEAVKQCLDAAATEYALEDQKALLKAASFGKSFVNPALRDDLYHTCQKLRVLNAIRDDFATGIPLTLKQFELLGEMDDKLGYERLTARIMYRRHFALARKICHYLKLEDLERDLLKQWACYKVEHNSQLSDSQIASSIVEKLGDDSGVSFADIACKAIEKKKNELAVMLLDHEPRSQNQIPLLVQMKEYKKAMEKAIDSGDSNLIYQVIFALKDNSLDSGDFQLKIRAWPLAHSLLMKYYSIERPELLKDIYSMEDRHTDMADCLVAASYTEPVGTARVGTLRKALQRYKQAQDEWAVQTTEAELQLLEKQQQLEQQNIHCVGSSLHETLRKLIIADDHKAVEQLRKDFKVPDRRFWWLRVNALAQANNWIELENFSQTKKSPIGYRPFVEACTKHGNKQEAVKYLVKVAPDEKVMCLIVMGELEQATEAAFQRKNEDELNTVLKHCTLADRAIIDRIQRLKTQLK